MYYFNQVVWFVFKYLCLTELDFKLIRNVIYLSYKRIAPNYHKYLFAGTCLSIGKIAESLLRVAQWQNYTKYASENLLISFSFNAQFYRILCQCLYNIFSSSILRVMLKINILLMIILRFLCPRFWKYL